MASVDIKYFVVSNSFLAKGQEVDYLICQLRNQSSQPQAAPTPLAPGYLFEVMSTTKLYKKRSFLLMVGLAAIAVNHISGSWKSSQLQVYSKYLLMGY